YEFTYMAAGRRRPDAPKVLEARVQQALDEASARVPGLPVIAGGKSMGGRMTSTALAHTPRDGVAGLLFLGFPLHAPGKRDATGTKRADHLFDLGVPMLFVQGTRDRLADVDMMTDLCRSLGKRATLHIVDGGDHSFNVLKRSGRDQSEVMQEIADAVSSWINKII
ncbi:MAG: alpha/beta hydrolase, partial [Candidatus Latescibacterota bacterium]